ncbi:protein FAM73B-like protein [Dinothrombium tinctorium]|uniref:Protein FAM73B-like protein n=1 Tax=Dinothrombium tinctorium TaxID=1965070 RepID=A0A3S3NZP8_9ACAR|nr:protein FAM73B-like protein [Dinothrombium tinctorium]
MSLNAEKSIAVRSVLKRVAIGEWQLSDNSKYWLKLVFYTGTTIGALYVCSKLAKRVFISRRTVKKQLNVNGLKAIANEQQTEGKRSSEERTNENTTTVGNNHNTNHNNNRASVAGEESIAAVSVECLPTSAASTLTRNKPQSSTRYRIRTDSNASASTTLLICTRSPSELSLYGLEAIKRAVRLFDECRARNEAAFGDVKTNALKLESIISKARQLIEEIDEFRKEITPEREFEEHDFGRTFIQDDEESISSSHEGTINSTVTLPYFDIEPNIHFFKLYTQALDNLDSIQKPRVNRTIQVNCESDSEFFAKVHCLREAFSIILAEEENRQLFIEIGKDILNLLLTHSLQDPTECLASYYNFLDYVSNTENHENLRAEVATRSIPCLSFYDLVLDYIILDSFDDLENPPSAVLSVANNRWLSAGFRELALQTAVSAVLRHKRSKLANSAGFFAHFYNILDHVSPILAWGFLGTDFDLKFKCNLIKESLSDLIRDYFNFDKVRYTSLQDLSHDILKLTKEEYCELQSKLSVC